MLLSLLFQVSVFHCIVLASSGGRLLTTHVDLDKAHEVKKTLRVRWLGLLLYFSL
jgi:hypothetical protein